MKPLTKGYYEFFMSECEISQIVGCLCNFSVGGMVQYNSFCSFLILEYSGSEFLLGILFSVRMFLFAVSQPFNGLLADRFNRKTLMLWSNILQVGLALSFLFVDGEEDMWWLIGLSGLMMLLHGIYVTAERAASQILLTKKI